MNSGLKAVNDTSGHGVGDAYIRAIAQTLKSGLEPLGPVGRWGGDEFTAMVPGVPESQVVSILDTLLQSILPLTAPRSKERGFQLRGSLHLEVASS